MPQVKPEVETFAKIKVVGVGGSGGSAVDRMVRSGIRGVEFIVMNTDVQALHHNSASGKLHIGKTITRGLGAGMDPEVGKRAAEESQNEIREFLKDADMVFITCGLGGGTGSGASPVIAQIAHDMGALTVAVVTKPFSFEGAQRRAIGEAAYNALASQVDTIITIPNDKVLQIVDKKTSLLDAFKIVDDVLRQGVQGISELITVPGLINVDFADVKTIMKDTGSALMGIGVGKGENRAVEAANAAISSPLLELSIDGARGILFTITGGNSLGMQEVSEAAKIITSSADENAKVIFGTVIDESLGEEIRITVIATGFEEPERRARISEEEAQSMFKAKPQLTAPTFIKKKPSEMFREPVREVVRETIKEKEIEIDIVEETPRANVFSSKTLNKEIPSKPAFQAPTVQAPTQKTNVDESGEDLEIPAFIRRKMGM